MALDRLALELVLVDLASAGIRGIAGDLKNLGAAGQQAGKHFEDAGQRFANGIKALRVGQELKAQLVDPGVQAASTLQDALTRLQVQLDPTSVEQMKAQLADASADASRIAAPTPFSGTQIIDLQTDLKRAGLGFDTIVGEGGAAEATALLAAAEQLDLGTATEAMVTLGAIFELQGDEFAGAADTLARAGSASATNAGQLSEALAQVPAAGALGLGSDETLAGLGVLANQGTKGGAAGTALNAFLRQAAKADQQFAEIDFYDDDGNFRGLQAAAENLREAMGERPIQQQQLALQKAFGDEGAKFAMALLREGDGSLEDVLAKMDGARGLNDRVDLQASTLSGQMQAMQGSTETALATLFTPALEPLTQGAAKANEALTALNDAALANPELAKMVSFGALGTVGLAGAYGLGQLGAGGVSGMLGLKALSGVNLASGLAKGKAVEAATGVQSVFVVNWPDDGFGGGSSVVAGGGSGLAGKAMAVTGAGAVGYGIGTFANRYVQDAYTSGNTLPADLIQGIIGQSALTYGQLFMDDEQIEAAKNARRQAGAALGLFSGGYNEGGATTNGFDNRAAQPFFDVTVNVQGDQADVEVRTQDGQVVGGSQRSGAPA